LLTPNKCFLFQVVVVGEDVVVVVGGGAAVVDDDVVENRFEELLNVLYRQSVV